jgi:hypothetical protein
MLHSANELLSVGEELMKERRLEVFNEYERGVVRVTCDAVYQYKFKVILWNNKPLTTFKPNTTDN